MLNAIVVGNVGQDAELKYVGENAVLSFSIASNSEIKGEKKVTWVRCSLWGQTRAEGLAPHVVKGMTVTVIGSLDVREYEKDGETRTSLDLRVDQFAFGGGASASRENGAVSDDEFPHGANEPPKKSTIAKPGGKPLSRNGGRPMSPRDRKADASSRA